MQERIRATLGGAFVEACAQLCPESDATQIILDLDAGPFLEGEMEEGVVDIWLTEGNVGGGGILEELFVRYSSDPRRFFRMVEGALRPSDFELIDSEVTRFLKLLEKGGAIATEVASLRGATTHQTLSEQFDELLGSLKREGLFVCHPVVAAISARVLRAGSSPKTDHLLLDLIRGWKAEESRLGIEIDARSFALRTQPGQLTGLRIGRPPRGCASRPRPRPVAAWKHSTAFSGHGALSYAAKCSRATTPSVRCPFATGN